MADALSLSMSCPICLETMVPPIFLCTEGHSICGTCIRSNSIENCPLCRSRMTDKRSFALEDLISQLRSVSLRDPCINYDRGCKYELTRAEKDSHQRECKNRVYTCEGDKFGIWQCNWTGTYADILGHFITAHRGHTSMGFKSEVNLKVNFQCDFSEIQIIDYKDGQQIFWYKHKIDVQNQKAYWLFQYVGTKKQAATYYYELEIFNGDVRKLKINELCKSDAEDAHTIFRTEKCLTLSLQTVKNFLNEQGELPFRFRIMKIHRSDAGGPPSTPPLRVVAPRPAYVPPVRGPLRGANAYALRNLQHPQQGGRFESQPFRRTRQTPITFMELSNEVDRRNSEHHRSPRSSSARR